jgi:hypothetical protein
MRTNMDQFPQADTDPANTGRIQETKRFKDGTTNIRYRGTGTVSLGPADSIGHFDPATGTGVAGFRSRRGTEFYIAHGVLMVVDAATKAPSFYGVADKLEAGLRLTNIELGKDWGGGRFTGQSEPIDSVSFMVTTTPFEEGQHISQVPNPLVVAEVQLRAAADNM